MALIVVGTDFSPGAAHALAEARELSLKLGGRIGVLHVREGSRRGEWRPDDAQRAWLRAASLEPDAVVIRAGVPWVEIIRHAAEGSAAMIVVGSHGASGFQPIGLGSTATKLAIASPLPVLVVSPRAAEGKPQRQRRQAGSAGSAGAGD